MVSDTQNTRAGTGAPGHWETDAVLLDGGSIHIRPVQPADAPALAAFHARLSPETVRMRFFSVKPVLTPAELERFTTVDHVARVALVAELGGQLVGVARYDRLADEPDEAEVAFVVADEHQGRGIGTVLLAHLASAARERGITRFVAETLAENRAMLGVFRAAGFERRAQLRHGLVTVEMTIEPTDESLAAQEQHEHRAEANSIARLLRPRSIAVIGASRNPDSVGYQVLRNLLDGGFDGPVYPINPRARHVASVRAYPSVLDVPDDIDLAVVAVPASAVREAIESCGEKHAAGVVVLSAGFAELGADGAEAQRQLREVARRNGMRMVGPNCIGVANTAIGMNATFSPYAPHQGRMAMQSQSGALGIALLERSSRMGLGVSTFVSVGNKADVSGNDLLQYWEDDPGTDVILLYIESFGNPRKFSRIARRVSRRKPIVAVKSGRSAAGVRAASSHTAAMATPDVAVDALFRQTGVIRVDTLDQLFDVAILLGSQPLPAGRRVAVVGNSGGPGILATDACDGVGLEIPELDDVTQTRLKAVVDPNGAVANPVDLVASATPAIYRSALEILTDDETVDALIVICTPTFAAPPDEVARAVGEVATATDKPIVCCFLAWPEMPPLIEEGGGEGRAVPSFASPEPAARALAAAATYSEWRQRPPGSLPDLEGFDHDQIRDALTAFLGSHPEGGWAPLGVVDEILAAAGITHLEVVTVDGPGPAAQEAARLGFPVALKAVGDEIVHKSDVGGVRLDLETEVDVRDAFLDMSDRLGPMMRGAVIQPMASPGVETIAGVVLDPLFGPLVMFGVGGIATELIGDRSFRILPLTDADAAELVRSLKSSPLLFGYRGSAPAAVERLEDLLQRLGRLAAIAPEIAELDLNPIIVTNQEAVVVDARVRIAPATPPIV
jgi:acetyl coenzyme A synthetase (ADP forming)-like protein